MYPLKPYSKKYVPYAWWRGAFTEQELDVLQERARNSIESAKVGGGGVDSNIRRSEITWLPPTEENRDIFNKLENVIRNLNGDFFQFSLTGIYEPIQLTNYSSQQQGTYSYHQDFNGDTPRKLSLCMQLSRPEEYEGGNLELLHCGVPSAVPRERGLIAVFPSWTLHQVTPVISGSRQSLVSWIGGPAFI